MNFKKIYIWRDENVFQSTAKAYSVRDAGFFVFVLDICSTIFFISKF